MRYTKYTEPIESELIELWLTDAVYTSVLHTELYGNIYLSFIDFCISAKADSTELGIYNALITNSYFTAFCNNADLFATEVATNIAHFCIKYFLQVAR